MDDILNDEKKTIFSFCSKIPTDNLINIKLNLSYLNLKDLFTHFSKKFKYEKLQNLQIIYNYVNNIKYLIEIDNLDNISTYINFFKKNQNHIIFNSLIKNNDKSLKISKIENNDKNLLLSHYNLKFTYYSKNKPNSVDLDKIKNLKFNDMYEINFTYFSYILFTIESNKYFDLSLILSSVQYSNNIGNLYNKPNEFLLKIQLQIKSKIDNESKLNILYKIIADILKIINRSHLIVNSNLKNDILLKYSKLINNNLFNQHTYLSRKSISLDKKDCITNLPNKYAVTDKADGERHLLFISGNNVLLLSTDLSIKHTGIVLNTNKFNNTLIDGELIINNDMQLFMSFDIIFKNGKDLRSNSLNERISNLHLFLNECFKIKIPNNKSNLTNLTDICKNEIDLYINNFTNKYKYNNFNIYYKFYAFSKGLQENEIFIYSDLIWSIFTSKNTKIPYMLDGLIYTPITNEYISSSSPLKEYKLKPIEHLTIDFYIKFEKNKKTGEFITIFDNTNNNLEYCKCYLYINDTSNKNKHIPILFREKFQEHYTYLKIHNNTILSLKNERLDDNIVVEFSYNSENEKYFKWIPNRIRYDKTDIIKKYKKNYGNNELTASYNWNIIVNPISFQDIKLLATDYSFYKKKLFKLSNNKFYDFKTGYVLPMRAFHNWIKHTLIFNYCRILSNNKLIDKKNILDIGIGKGGDLIKLFSAGINSVVGIDVDNNSFNIPNGTIDKFKNLISAYSKNINILPKEDINNSINGTFIKANPSFELFDKDQLQVYPDLSQANIKLINKYLNKDNTYDIVNCQFTLHYIFEKRDYVINFFKNINRLLKPNGFLLITCFDDNIIFNALKKNDGLFEIFEIDNEKNVLFSITNLYKNDTYNSQDFGLPINITNKLYSAIPKIEYIVKKDILIKYANQYGNLELYETNLFYNFYELNRDLINTVYSNNLFNDVYSKHFEKIYNFYNFKDSIDKYSLEFSKLNRFYVFRKK